MSRWIWTIAWLAGCDFTLADDFGTPTTVPSPIADTTDPTAPGTGDTGPVPPDFTCADQWAESLESQIVVGDTDGQENLLRPTCRGEDGLEDGPEVLVGFTAPVGGTWEFDLVDPPGNDFDTVLAVLASCGGAELACDDDFELSTRRSRVTLALEQGQTVLVQVDGFLETDRGPFALSIEAL